jgi:hypothetical protein
VLLAKTYIRPTSADVKPTRDLAKTRAVRKNRANAPWQRSGYTRRYAKSRPWRRSCHERAHA